MIVKAANRAQVLVVTHSEQLAASIAAGGAIHTPTWQRVFWAVLEGAIAATIGAALAVGALWLGVRMGAAWYDRAQAETYQAVAAF